MIKKTCIVVIAIFTVQSANSQLSTHIANGAWAPGFHIGFGTIKNNQLTYVEGRKHGPYFGVGVDLAYSTFEAGEIRYYLDAKWTMDLVHKGVELFKGTGTDARIDFTGFTWHKLGINVFATDNLCIGVGGSFADYIIDIPLYANNNGDFFAGITWQEPSGWNWTAGPCFFADYGIGDFAASLTTSYDFTYLTPKITDDYEALTDKIDGYKPPHFMYFDLTINHETGVYLSINRTTMIDKGDLGNNMSRGEIKMGWRWWL